MGEDPPAIDPAMLERLRRGVPLRMTATGRFVFDGAPVTHPRVDAALRAGLDITDDGEPTVRIGQHWCYLTIDDLPLRATAAHVHGDRVRLRLDDGRTLPLRPATLWEEPELGLRCTVPAAGSGRPLGVRMTNRAQIDLAPHVELDPDGTPVLVLGPARQRIPARKPTTDP